MAKYTHSINSKGINQRINIGNTVNDLRGDTTKWKGAFLIIRIKIDWLVPSSEEESGFTDMEKVSEMSDDEP